MSAHHKLSATQKKNNSSPTSNQSKQIPTTRGAHPTEIIQRARMSPQSLIHSDVVQLQKTMGNRAVCQLMQEIGLMDSKPVQKKENNTGLPDNLKAGVENLSGLSMDAVKVHYNSDKPAQVGALAYTQGTDIHVAPGQEKHLPHEAWHVVQQSQGRVQPTMQLKGVSVNDDDGMEREASVMGSRAVNLQGGLFEIGHSQSQGAVAQFMKEREKEKEEKPAGVSKGPHGIKKRGKYGMGTHGYRKKEQQHFKVSGKTHQSEHTIGFAVLNKGSGSKRGDHEVKDLEEKAPAYQEVYGLHRDHIGTGTHDSDKFGSGFSSNTYRDTQRQLIEDGDVSSAVQINQLGYAFNPDFQKKGDDKTKADESFNRMVENMQSVEFINNGGARQQADVDKIARAEMYLSRIAASTKTWPTKKEIEDVKKMFGIVEDKKEEKMEVEKPEEKEEEDKMEE